MSRVALVLAHDGTDFAGWQLQPESRTIQGELERALSTACAQDVRVHASGRTDAGVHARGQVAHADVTQRWHADPVGLRGRLAGLLPRELRARAVVPVDESFDARKSASAKTYRYSLHVASLADPLSDRFRAHVSTALDAEAMERAAGRFVGEKDFASLQSTGSSVQTSVREITVCRIEGELPDIDLVVEGTGFLRHMVRAMAGCLLSVGRRRHPPEWIDELLEARDRTLAAENAPARGLCLESVRYPEPWGPAIEQALDQQERAHPLHGEVE